MGLLEPLPSLPPPLPTAALLGGGEGEVRGEGSQRASPSSPMKHPRPDSTASSIFEDTSNDLEILYLDGGTLLPSRYENPRLAFRWALWGWYPLPSSLLSKETVMCIQDAHLHETQMKQHNYSPFVEAANTPPPFLLVP
jgi:hypothetical protein